MEPIARRILVLSASLLLSLGLVACSDPETRAQTQSLDQLAERYMKLALVMPKFDPAFVDAYFGPEGLRSSAERDQRDANAIRQAAVELLGSLRAARPAADHDAHWRWRWLYANTQAMITRLDLVSGQALPFDEESARLYDAVAPIYDEAHFQRLRDRLDEMLPGEGSVPDRYRSYRAGMVIPPERIGEVFDAAIQECRARTAERIDLPDGERFTVEFVQDKPWSGYNWYQGGAESLIQVNDELPIHIDRAVDLACHEGYPGHHVFNALIERSLVDGEGWDEFSLYPLFSAQSLIAEGTANFGVDMVFPGEERRAFEAEVLFPLAGLDPAEADRYAGVQEVVSELSYAGNEAARRYLDGEWDAERAVDWLMEYALSTREKAEQRIDFFDTYRSYVINYNLGRDLVANAVEARAGNVDQDRRWSEFESLLRRPELPSELAVYLPGPDAERIAQDALIVDTHIDVPYRLQNRYEDVGVATESGDFDHPRAERGGLDAAWMSIYIPAELEREGGAFELAEELIDGVEAIVSAHPDKFALARSTDEVMAAEEAGLIALPMGMENGAPIEGDLEKLRHFHQRGIRYITLAHSESNHLSDSSYDEARPAGGLTPFGVEVVEEMNRLGIMVDISHLSDAAAEQVLVVSQVPVIASHSSARAFTPGKERNMSDTLIGALAANGGVIQINYGSTFLTAEADEWGDAFWEARDAFIQSLGGEADPEALAAWTADYRARDPLPYADVSDVLDHIDHVVALVGIEHVGIGSDYDGVGDSLPIGLKDAASYPRLVQGLINRGYDEAAIRAVLGGNLMRVWREVEAYAVSVADAPIADEG